jgi:hypothetical protein
MKTIIISKYSKDFVMSLTSKITFKKVNENLVSFELTRDDFKKLFTETVKTGNNPFELYSWDKNILSHYQ